MEEKSPMEPFWWTSRGKPCWPWWDYTWGKNVHTPALGSHSPICNDPVWVSDWVLSILAARTLCQASKETHVWFQSPELVLSLCIIRIPQDTIPWSMFIDALKHLRLSRTNSQAVWSLEKVLLLTKLKPRLEKITCSHVALQRSILSIAAICWVFILVPSTLPALYLHCPHKF